MKTFDFGATFGGFGADFVEDEFRCADIINYFNTPPKAGA